jgi:hypothetical protein
MLALRAYGLKLYLSLFLNWHQAVKMGQVAAHLGSGSVLGRLSQKSYIYISSRSFFPINFRCLRFVQPTRNPCISTANPNSLSPTPCTSSRARPAPHAAAAPAARPPLSRHRAPHRARHRGHHGRGSRAHASRQR